MTVNEIVRNIASEHGSKQLAGIEQAVNAMSTIGGNCVDALEESDNRIFLAERLAPVSSMLAPLLKRRLHDAHNDEFLLVGALLLLDSDQATASEILIRLIDSGKHICLAGQRLAEKGIYEAAPSLLKRLALYPDVTLDEALCIVAALQRLKVPLPAEIRDRIRLSPDIPWQLSTALQ